MESSMESPGKCAAWVDFVKFAPCSGCVLARQSTIRIHQADERRERRPDRLARRNDFREEKTNQTRSGGTLLPASARMEVALNHPGVYSSQHLNHMILLIYLTTSNHLNRFRPGREAEERGGRVSKVHLVSSFAPIWSRSPHSRPSKTFLEAFARSCVAASICEVSASFESS